MNKNEICNTKTEVTLGLSLNEKDYINSLLSNLKNITKNYVISMTEASNETLFKKYYETFDKLILLQRTTYEAMFKKGWYVLEKSEKTKIDKKLKTLNQEFLDLKIK